jgi:serine/threonine-protein kinase
MRPRFEREALALAALSHPNIVRLQDYGVTSGLQYLVMELIEGRTLREVIDQDGPLTVPRAIALTRQLAHALAYAHEQNIVHRDLKPLNVLVQALPHQPEHLKVLDFGFAKFLPGSELEAGAPVTRAGITFGSPAYISPEQCTGDAIDGRADLYSVGVLLFEMLTGKPPFEGEISDLLRQHIQAAPPRLADKLPALADRADVQALVDKLLEKSRAQRYANAGDLLAALDEIDAHGRASGISLRAQTPSLAHVVQERVSLAYARWQPIGTALRARASVYAREGAKASRIGARYVAVNTQHALVAGWQWSKPRVQALVARSKNAIERLRK